MKPSTFAGYKAACQRVVECFGREAAVTSFGPDDFIRLRRKLAESLGAAMASTDIVRIRSMFKFAFDQELINKPLRYGQGFSVVDKRILRQHRNNTDRTFTADQIRCVLASADPMVRAVTLLGINNALGPHDAASLCWSHMLGSELIFPRPKTGVERRSILWPETLEALDRKSVV